MKVKELFNVISDDREIQIGSYETGRPLTNRNCLAFSNGEFERYSNYDIFMIGIGIDRCGTPYMKILIKSEHRKKNSNDCRSE